MTDEFIESLMHDLPKIQSGKHVILLTGSTGSLGSHVLARLVHSQTVAKIVCLCRGSRATPAVGSNGTNGNGSGNESLLEYQRNALSAAGIPEFDEASWSKVKLLNIDEVFSRRPEHQDAEIGNPQIQNHIFDRLATEITHIVHLAWPMDFQRTLASFRPHVDLVRSLIELSQHANSVRPGTRVRLLFASSIAAVRYHGTSKNGVETGATNGSSSAVIPEELAEDPLVTVPMGYAEAKWVCERMLDHAGRNLGASLEPVVVRIGQLTGPEGTPGTWKTGEHFPALIKACQRVGAFPDLEGVRSFLFFLF